MLGKKDNNPNPNLELTLEKKDYRMIHLPDVDTVVHTSFPFRNMLSILFAVWRCYPKMVAYVKVL
jgi:hypothetical protein